MGEMTTTRGATPVQARALGPDLARGFMLLFIALANSHYFLDRGPFFGGFPVVKSASDQVVAWTIATFVDGRAFPMFGLLFGYGVAQIVRRQEGRAPREVRRLLRRRASVLVVVGFLHALLLFAGDILTAYGVLLFLGAWAVRWKDRWLLGVALLFLLLQALPGDGILAVSTDPPGPGMLPPDLAAQLRERPFFSLFVGLLGPIGFMTPFLTGLWAGRRRILERPEEHRRLLGVTAVLGIGAAALGAQPVSLATAGWIERPRAAALEVLGPLHDVSGVLGGFGYAALICLLAVPLGRRGSGLVDAVAAVGQRSMTCYLAQSVVWAVVFTPYLLDLSRTLTPTTTAVLALATWSATVALAHWMRRTGRRGPFEVLVRRVTYGRE